MAIATMTSKGQVTIPARVRQALGLDSGDRIEFVEIAKNQFAILPATGSVRELRGLLRNRPKKPVSIADMNRAIAKGASRSR
jgi:antitoxin PrlF